MPGEKSQYPPNLVTPFPIREPAAVDKKAESGGQSAGWNVDRADSSAAFAGHTGPEKEPLVPKEAQSRPAKPFASFEDHALNAAADRLREILQELRACRFWRVRRRAELLREMEQLLDFNDQLCGGNNPAKGRNGQ
jgi:hypothetical protein